MIPFSVLGDTHLGRTFTNNVPLHRRGDREQMVRDQFRRELMSKKESGSIHVHMGDLFDKPIVDLNTLLFAADIYRSAAAVYPDTEFFVLQGNHDAHRDVEKASSFDVFASLVENCDNITVVRHIVHLKECTLIPWSPTKSALEMVKRAFPTPRSTDHTVFAHWDLDLRSPDYNLIPTNELADAGVKTVYNGHIHLPSSFKRGEVTVHGTGSMQPYAFGEDAQGTFYIDLDLETARNIKPELIKDKCVRITLKPGEIFDLTLDVLQVQVRTIEENEPVDLRVSFEEFDLAGIYNTSLEKFAMSIEVREKLSSLWKEAFSA